MNNIFCTDLLSIIIPKLNICNLSILIETNRNYHAEMQGVILERIHLLRIFNKIRNNYHLWQLVHYMIGSTLQDKYWSKFENKLSIPYSRQYQGISGSGKSTLISWIPNVAANSDDDDFAASEHLDFISDVIQKNRLSNQSKSLYSLVKTEEIRINKRRLTQRRCHWNYTPKAKSIYIKYHNT